MHHLSRSRRVWLNKSSPLIMIKYFLMLSVFVKGLAQLKSVVLSHSKSITLVVEEETVLEAERKLIYSVVCE